MHLASVHVVANRSASAFHLWTNLWTGDMPKTTHRLTAVSAQNIKKPGMYADGAGLYLKIGDGGSKSWVYRYMLLGKPRYLGLGSTGAVSLAAARGLAGLSRQQIQQGLDPIDARKHLMAQSRLAGAKALTFKQCAEALMTAHDASWRNLKHRQQWRNTLAVHVYPTIGHLAASAVTTEHVLSILEPIWAKTPDTASRIRGRIESVLEAAKARGARDGENPARWRGHLASLLPKPSRIKRVQHHAALPFFEVPEFMSDLRLTEGVAPRALEFAVLTAARSNEVRGARWPEINFAERTWTIPPERMKSGKEHRVPLSSRAIEILTELQGVRVNDFVFPGVKPGRPVNNATLHVLLGRMGRDDVTVHGFRSTFRDWAAETTSFPNFVVEMALAHAIGDGVEAAYRRGDLFEKRRKLMNAWSRFAGDRAGSVIVGKFSQKRASSALDG